MTTHLIVGANRGIGLELAKQLASQTGAEVIATTRKPSDALNAIGVEVIEGIDVTDHAVGEKLLSAIGGRSLDGLIVNAGILRRESLGELDFESIRAQLEVNALGPLRVIDACRAKLVEGSKVGILTSRMGSVEDNTSGGMYGYRMSKAAVNMAGKSLANDLAKSKVAVRLLHPGYVRTDMTGKSGHIDADESARMLLERYAEITLETTGQFFHANGEELPW